MIEMPENRRRHVQQYAFIKRRNEFGIQASINRNGQSSRDQNHSQNEALVAQRVLKSRLVEANQEAVERVPFALPDPAA